MAVITSASATRAHVAPSVDDNNRYLKLTPLGDRVRLAYTVFYGEVPGAGERQRIDTDHDGKLSPAEGKAFGDRIAAEVGPALDVEIDGSERRVTWASVDVGFGSDVTAAGAFSVDLVAYLCLPTARGSHVVTLRDRFRVPNPGETEARVEDSPGVTIEKTRVGPTSDVTNDYRFAGPGGPLEEIGLELHFTAGPRSTVTADGICIIEATPHGARWAFALGALALVAIAGAIVVIARVKRRRHES